MELGIAGPLGTFPWLFSPSRDPEPVKAFLGLMGKGLGSIFTAQTCAWAP